VTIQCMRQDRLVPAEYLLRKLVHALIHRTPGDERSGGLDPQLRALINLQRRAGLPALDQLELRWFRLIYQRMGRGLDAPAASLHAVRGLTIPGPAGPLPARLYQPTAAPQPLMLYFHGGGFCSGGLASHDRPCRLLALATGRPLLAVDYRLAPEQRYPAAVEDCWAALRWAAESGRSLGASADGLAVCGDSAGGNLAAVVALRARDAGLPLTLQVLLYPGLDFTCSAPSHAALGQGYVLTSALIQRFLSYYLPEGHDLEDPEVSPLFAADLRGLAPALVVTAGFDPLHDEAQRFVERLRDSAVPVRQLDFPRLIHGFLHVAGVVDGARSAIEAIGRSVGTSLS
jgi:acetyl esterase/lipase